MMNLHTTLRRVTFLAFVVAMQPLEAANFEPPDMEGYLLHDERDADGDGDKVNETHIQHYLNQDGNSIFSMTTNGRLGAWSLDTRDDESGDKNYVIRDSNCDDIFDEVYGLDQEYQLPDCVKSTETDK